MKIFVIILMGLTLSACSDEHKYRMACLEKGGVLEYKLVEVKEENTRYGNKYLKPEYFYTCTLSTK